MINKKNLVFIIIGALLLGILFSYLSSFYHADNVTSTSHGRAPGGCFSNGIIYRGWPLTINKPIHGCNPDINDNFELTAETFLPFAENTVIWFLVSLFLLLSIGLIGRKLTKR